MTKTIETNILIHASVEKVWAVLVDFDQYPNWNPFINSISGELKVGQTIKVKIAAPDSKPMIFQPKILTFIPNKEFSWLGYLFFKSLFKGVHQFKLIDNGNGSTTFQHNEIFNGLLIPLLQKQLDTKTKKGFEMMNIKLKEKAELL
jgi:hypothetical protein